MLASKILRQLSEGKMMPVLKYLHSFPWKCQIKSEFTFLPLARMVERRDWCGVGCQRLSAGRRAGQPTPACPLPVTLMANRTLHLLGKPRALQPCGQLSTKPAQPLIAHEASQRAASPSLRAGLKYVSGSSACLRSAKSLVRFKWGKKISLARENWDNLEE